jgi:aspartate/methionine/tyrosine aminotransferase
MFIREILSPERWKKSTTIFISICSHRRTEHLRKACASFYEGMDPSRVFMTNGSAEALFLMAWGIIEPGDEVAFMIPNFMLLSHVVESNGAVVLDFHLDPDRGWSLDLDSLKKAVTPKTKLICVCNPNNPTGTVLSRDQMKQVVEIASEADAYLLSDEVYRGAEQTDEMTPSFWECTTR